jgi:uncharacterized protein YlaN (UPF0358 family)
MTLQEAISQAHVQVAVHNARFLIALVRPDMEEEDIPIINQYEELLTKQLEKFIQPNIPGLDGEISMDIKLAKVEMERAKVAIQIFDTVNRITEYLIKNCRGVMA